MSKEQLTYLFLHLGLLLLAARVLGEIMKRIGQPGVLGELLAGILLGPSLLGWLSPAAYAKLFPASVAWMPSLQTIAWFGLALLMLLTGLETDVRQLRSLGRPAFMVSLFGLAIPMAAGGALGWLVPDRFLGPGAVRSVLGLFLATALAIPAMPVIAKILLDLKIVRRNVGILTLTSAVIDDTVGWIVLAILAGVATNHAFDATNLLRTLGYLAGFLVLARFLVYPLARWALRVFPGAQLFLLLFVTFLCAAASEAIGVHAVFGCFVAGAIFRQCASLEPDTVHRIEGVVSAAFAPLFFSLVGLRVDLTIVQGYAWPAIILGVAVVSKTLGCTLGGLVGRLRFREALAIGTGLSARGAMGLVVALVGLNLGILGGELFSILVLMALVTSFLAPILLRPIVRGLPMTDEERDREKPAEAGLIPATALRLLVPVSGGPNAILGCHIGAHLCRTEADSLTALFVEQEKSFWKRWFRRRRDGPFDVEAYFRQLRAAAGKGVFNEKRIPASGTVSETILREAKSGYQFLLLGASGQTHAIYDPFISRIIRAQPCHILVLRAPQTGLTLPVQFKSILVPSNGSYFSDAAFQLAAAYARRTGARVTVLFVTKPHEENPLFPGTDPDDLDSEKIRSTLRAQVAGRLEDSLLDCKVRSGASVAATVAIEAETGGHDLVLLGAENKSFVERVYLGQNVDASLELLECATAVFLPKVR